MSDDGTFTWKARTRGCQCCKWKDERIAELEAENKMLRKLAQAEAMAAVRTEHDLVYILINSCKKTEIGREALLEWDLARTAKGGEQ